MVLVFGVFQRAGGDAEITVTRDMFVSLKKDVQKCADIFQPVSVSPIRISQRLGEQAGSAFQKQTAVIQGVNGIFGQGEMRKIMFPIKLHKNSDVRHQALSGNALVQQKLIQRHLKADRRTGKDALPDQVDVVAAAVWMNIPLSAQDDQRLSEIGSLSETEIPRKMLFTASVSRFSLQRSRLT